MSLNFNQTSSPYDGIVQIYEREIGAPLGHVSGNTVRLGQFVADANLAWDSYIHMALTSSGRWQFDDADHSGDPVYKTNLVSGTYQYALTTDSDSALILEVHRVAILPSATATLYEEIFPVDVQTDYSPGGLLEENTDGGTPTVYEIMKNEIWLDPIPNYNATNGLKVYISREPTYFTTSDTTSKPGCPGIHHKYFALKPALDFARRNNLTNYNAIAREVERLEKEIVEFFSKRLRNEKDIAYPDPICFT